VFQPTRKVIPVTHKCLLTIFVLKTNTGVCGTCATSFTPHTLSSSLSSTGEHGVEKIFAPGQVASASGGSASDFAPGQLKP
jgi:hypothetical protein